MNNDDAFPLANPQEREQAVSIGPAARAEHFHQDTIAASGNRSRCQPEAADATKSEIGEHVHYQIHIQGHLDSTWSEWFDGLAIVNLDGGVTMLEGDLADQPALHGVLCKIRDLGLPLLAVVKVATGHAGDCPVCPDDDHGTGS